MGSRLVVDRSPYVSSINACLLEDCKGKYILCHWKETWVLAKGMQWGSSVSSTSQGRGSNRWSKKYNFIVETSGGGLDSHIVEDLVVKDYQWIP